MEQIACKECTSPDCHGCNMLRLEQMLKDGKFDALMDENRGIKVKMSVRPAVRARWGLNKPPRDLRPCCSSCGDLNPVKTNFCPNCGADMRPEPQKEE